MLTTLMQRGASFLGTRYALMGGAMTWVSDASLVSAISNAGGFGVLASGAMQPAHLEAEIIKTRALTSKPFGVNLIVLSPYLEGLARVCAAHNISHVVLAGGLPSAAIINPLRAAGCKVLAFAPALVIARKLVKMGVDALILEGSEAGGHIGAVSTSVLAQEILPHIKEVPIFVGGGIGHGSAIALYLKMGAAGCQLGTRFVCASESTAHLAFKQAFIKANARDAVASTQLDPRFPVIPVRAIHNDASKAFAAMQSSTIKAVDAGTITLKEGQLAIEHFWAGALRRAVVDGDVQNGSLMAGQSVGMVTRIQPAAEIIGQLMAEAA
jgi:enoyl-[acyl-carrier protein] reductase II